MSAGSATACPDPASGESRRGYSAATRTRRNAPPRRVIRTMAPCHNRITSRRLAPRTETPRVRRSDHALRQQRAARYCAARSAGRDRPRQNQRFCGAMGVPPSHPLLGAAPSKLFLPGRVSASQFLRRTGRAGPARATARATGPSGRGPDRTGRYRSGPSAWRGVLPQETCPENHPNPGRGDARQRHAKPAQHGNSGRIPQESGNTGRIGSHLMRASFLSCARSQTAGSPGRRGAPETRSGRADTQAAGTATRNRTGLGLKGVATEQPQPDHQHPKEVIE